MCWWPSSANVLPWREVFTKFYRFSASRFSRKCPFYRRSKHSTPNRTYSITLTSSFFSTSNRTGMISDLQKEVSVVIPSGGEEWKQVKVKDKYGRITERQIHTLGDSVLRVKDRFYLSGVDETGMGAGMYFFAELATKQAPPTLEEAYNTLKPKTVREAEGHGQNVLRQGEWFAIPARVPTSELLRDVERGIAAYRKRHVLGKDGHHELEEAVLYKAGERKGQVYARGVLRHTKDEHEDLDLGTVRWYLVVHNVVGASYTLSGKGTAQFD